MSDNTNFGFAKLVPGFDFLQNLAKGASQSMPSLSNWVAPTLNVEELDKRITELKAVHFWLDQNSKALLATIQALEVQKMTLATLQGMNFSMGELANALKLTPTEETQPKPAAPAAAAPKASAAEEKAASKPKAKGKAGNGAAGAAVDPLQWWGALTHQFQEIAANAMKDVAQKTATDTVAANAASVGKGPVKATAKKSATSAPSAPRKAATRRAKAT
jgi:hypothetical protein